MSNNLLALFGQFIDERLALGASPLTIKTYKDRCGQFVGWLVGNNQELTRATIITYVAELVKGGRSQITVRGYVQTISAFCNWMVELGYIPLNPAKKIKVKVPARKPPSYSRDQIIALLAACESLRDRAVIITLLDTGLRAAELCSMRWPDTNAREFSIIGKGNKERKVYIGEFTRSMIRAYVQFERGQQDGWLWLSRVKEPIGPKGIHTAIQRIADRAGIRADIRRIVHSFRATFAKSYSVGGGDLESLRELLGHSTLAMAAHYAQLNDNELHAKKIDIDPLAVIMGGYDDLERVLLGDIKPKSQN